MYFSKCISQNVFFKWREGVKPSRRSPDNRPAQTNRPPSAGFKSQTLARSASRAPQPWPGTREGPHKHPWKIFQPIFCCFPPFILKVIQNNANVNQMMCHMTFGYRWIEGPRKKSMNKMQEKICSKKAFPFGKTRQTHWISLDENNLGFEFLKISYSSTSMESACQTQGPYWNSLMWERADGNRFNSRVFGRCLLAQPTFKIYFYMLSVGLPWKKILGYPCLD